MNQLIDPIGSVWSAILRQRLHTFPTLIPFWTYLGSGSLLHPGWLGMVLPDDLR